MEERDLDETFDDEDFEDHLVAECYGEYGSQDECPTCPNRNECKKFTETERAIVRKYKGKYTGTGKFVEKDKY